MKDFLSHFNFRSTPFTREIPVKDHFKLPQFQEAEQALLRVLNHRMSAAVIAPAGCGKTTLMRKIRSVLPEARHRVHYVKVPCLSKRDMCREICTVIGSPPANSYPMLVRRIQECFLATADTDGLRPVLIIDEAHGIRSDVLGILRILTNFEMDSRLVVSIILIGQPHLRDVLNRHDMEDVARRIAHYAQLGPLARQENHDYIKHRCLIAGASQLPFETEAITAIFEIARGNLRATDMLSLKSLEVAFQKDSQVVDANHVVEARTYLWA